MSRWATRILVALAVVAALGACSTAPAVTPTVAPTLSPTPGPTFTPSATAFQRPTLPPTWTPTDIPTEGPTPTPYVPYGFPVATAPPDSLNPAACLEFGPDRARISSLVDAGQAVTVTWHASGGAVFYYEVVLRDAGGAVLDSTRARPSVLQYRFARGFFRAGAVYTWSVTPFDSSGDPICDTRTSELRVRSS